MLKYTKDTFISKSILKHGDKYDYSLVNYAGSNIKIDITCKKHGVFSIKPKEHLSGQGCIKCSCKGMDTDKFIAKSKEKHRNLYNYDKTIYVDNKTKLTITCSTHGDWICLPDPHYLRGIGCPKCRLSKGEEKIKQLLIENQINFIQQYEFNNCINPKTNRKLPFDFYIPNKNICIEYDGELHFKSIKYYGGKKSLLKIKYRDNIKTQFCLNNNITLIRISYKDSIYDNITKLIHG